MKNKILLIKTVFALCSLFFALNINAQSSEHNYIRTRTYTNETATEHLDQIQYFDGLGRPTETVLKGITPDQQDLVSLLEYNSFGREFAQWLPAKIENNNGNFVTLNSFKSTANSFHNDQRPFVEKDLEKSPLNRVLGQIGTGADWQSHPVTIQYLLNSAGEVPYFSVVNEQLQSNGNYAANTLYKTVSTDEDGKTAAEYKDKFGRVVMTSQANDHKTCYVYDDYGKLRYVLPPLATDNPSMLDEYAYIYKYDERGNQIYKKLPGVMVEPIFMVYDKANRLVLSQDGNQRTGINRDKKWTYFKYDVFGRLLYTGICTTRTFHATLQDNFKDIVVKENRTESDFGYTQTAYSGITYHELLTVNYYDNYNFLNLLDKNIKIKLTCNENSDYGTQYANAKTLLTGTHTYILDDSGNFLTTAFYYDDKGRIVQTRATNHLDGFDIVYNKYNFVGAVTNTLKEHSISPPEGDLGGIELYENEYDHAGRLTSTIYTLDGNDPIIIAENTYDDLGRLITKNRHSNADTEEFAYNIKNWLTQIKSGTTFQEDIFYNNVSGVATPCFNGNISATTIKTNNSEIPSYMYQYDALNRLTSAISTSSTFSSPNFVNTFHEYFTYDKHGNIETLQRYIPGTSGALGTLIDNLTLEYNGNQLQQVDDAAGMQNLYNTKEYNPKGDGTFEYDANGNLTVDSDRKILSIQYNVLNLPSQIEFEEGNLILNVYAADGRKLSSYYASQVTSNLNPIHNTLPIIIGNTIGTQVFNLDIIEAEGTHYINNFEYLFDIQNRSENITTTRIHNAEGYYKDGDFYYYRKDHLGNNREVVKFPSFGGAGVVGEVVQVTNYYASGVPWKYETDVESPYMFGGKEFIEMGGLDEYDYGARIRMGAVPRFETIDPLCERYYSISPYAYVANRFINATDPNGMWIEYWDGTNSYRYDNRNNTWTIYNNGKYEAFTPEKGSFLHGVLQGLNQLNNNIVGQDIISKFANDDVNAFINISEDGTNSSDINGRSVYLNSDFLGTLIPTTEGAQVSPFWLDIGHELAQVLEFITNENASQEWLKITNSDGSETSIPQVEKSSTHKENQMRASAGLPLRTHYVINTANGTGYEPSRILNINDNGDKQHRTITYTSKFYGTNYMQEAMLRTLDMTVRRAGR